MKENFAPSRKLLSQHEGGYSNHPSDPGGPTNHGITIYDANRYLNPALSDNPPWRQSDLDFMRALTYEQSSAIYKPKYWDALQCDRLESGVDYAVFDYGVNSGVGRSGRVLRRVLRLPDDTSNIDEQVIMAANARPAADLVKAICDERMRFLQGLRTWPVFGKGWGRRVNEVRSYGLNIARDIPIAADAPPLQPAPGRGFDPDKFARVRALQKQLAVGGHDPGAIDGDLGPKTIRAFQRSRGITPTGVVGAITRPMLDKALAEITPFPKAGVGNG
jgi:lysozyme family protein